MIVEDNCCEYQEGKRMYGIPYDLLPLRDLAKVYAYALKEWGGSDVRTRTILDAFDKVDDVWTTCDDIRGEFGDAVEDALEDVLDRFVNKVESSVGVG